MKRIIASILAVMLLFGTHGILAEGLLPSFTEVAGVPMPSLGEALQCWPDNETENEDGSVTEYYNNITKDKYEKFSAYLKEQGAELADYKIEGNVLTAEIRKDGASLILHYDSGTGEATVTYPANTYDERTQNAKALFMDAEKLLNEGKPDEAYKEITAIPQYESYEPAVSLISGNENLTTAARKEKISKFEKPGNIVTFGEYEQDNDLANGSEPIEWIVLDYDAANHRSMLISKYGLDNIIYDEWSTKRDVLWEDCMARKWLNEYFLYSAFNEEERKAIPITEVDNSESLKAKLNNKTTEVNNTQDQVFLLSVSEAMLYFSTGGFGQKNYEELKSYARARVAPTPYAIAQGAFASDKFQTLEGLPAGIWLLRTYIYDCQGASVNEGGVYADSNGELVARPVIWLDLDAVKDVLEVNSRKETEDETSEEAKAAQYARAGNIVTYGCYEQDNNLENGPEPIEWIVLTVDETNNRAMLISRYGLDNIIYDEWSTKKDVFWEDCIARKWLNQIFLYGAFNEEERKAIPITEVDNSESLKAKMNNKTTEVNNTQDRVFLLSSSEAMLYFGAGNGYGQTDYKVLEPYTRARVAPTPYAIAQGAFASDNFQTLEGLPAGIWLLRTYVYDCQGASVNEGGVYSDSRGSMVARPVIWLDLDAVNDILDVGNQKENEGEAAEEAKAAQYARVGNIVTYGMYEQDNNSENGPEPIEWIVLTVDEANHRALLVSKYGLDARNFHSERSEKLKVTWETCSLRKWLNNVFLFAAFNEDERKAILMTDVDNSDSLGLTKKQTVEVNNTQERIFVLSKSETILYFGGSEAKLRLAPTLYAIAQGAFISDQFQTIEGLPAGRWSLRTSDDEYRWSTTVFQTGAYNENKNPTGSGESNVVRPAFWLDLDAIKTAYQHGNETESGVGNLEEAERKTRIMQYTKPGNIVTYGMYEQDNDAANGPEAIEWIVLTYDEDNNRALMVSKYGLDTLQFHKDYRFGQKITWETCSAREWLNSTFLNNAFSEDEQKAIPTVELDNSDNLNPFKGQKAEANNTKDRIYLLSKSEAELYFNTEAGSRITPTAYAIAQGAIVSEKYQTIAGLPAGVWLLRTSTDSYHKVMAVNVSGILSEFKPNESENGSMAVLRPAFWLDLNAGIF